MSNQQLADNLHKPTLTKLKKHKVYSFFGDSIWVADLVDMQLRNKYNNRIQFLLYVMEIYSRYTWILFTNNA